MTPYRASRSGLRRPSLAMHCRLDRSEANTNRYLFYFYKVYLPTQISYYYSHCHHHRRSTPGDVGLKIKIRTYKPNYKTYSDCIQLRKYDNLLNIFGRRSITSSPRTEVCDTRREGRACNGPTRNGQAARSRQSLFDCRPD